MRHARGSRPRHDPVNCSSEEKIGHRDPDRAARRTPPSTSPSRARRCSSACSACTSSSGRSTTRCSTTGCAACARSIPASSGGSTPSPSSTGATCRTSWCRARSVRPRASRRSWRGSSASARSCCSRSSAGRSTTTAAGTARACSTSPAVRETMLRHAAADGEASRELAGLLLADPVEARAAVRRPARPTTGTRRSRRSGERIEPLLAESVAEAGRLLASRRHLGRARPAAAALPCRRDARASS